MNLLTHGIGQFIRVVLWQDPKSYLPQSIYQLFGRPTELPVKSDVLIFFDHKDI